jgi:predicted GIY-YIG superfamily endonuclease
VTYNDLIFPIPSKHLHCTNHHSNFVDNYYVYTWDDSGEPFYIGMGKKRRAWNTHNRDLESIKMMSRCFEITIIEDSLIKQEALELEMELIKQLDNLANKQGNILYHRTYKNSPLTKPQLNKWLQSIANMIPQHDQILDTP